MSDHNFNYYFIVKDVTTATDVLDILKQADVKEDNIGVVSKDTDSALADLPEVDLSEKSKLPQALKRGALLGSSSGLLAGVLLSIFPAAGVAVGGAAILAMTAGGGAFGAWSASLIGISEHSPLIKKFDASIDDGKTVIFCKLTEKQRNTVSDAVGSKLANERIESGEIDSKLQ
jgi:uncharacterized membrane protein